jgi:hypothetical protein
VSHAVIAKYFGAFPEVHVWRNENNVEKDEMAWIGQCGWTDLNRKVKKKSRRLIAMAGFLGEAIAIEKIDSGMEEVNVEEISNDLFSAFDDGALSKVDAQHIGNNLSGREVNEAIQLLLKNWEKVDRCAIELMTTISLVEPGRYAHGSVNVSGRTFCDFFGISASKNGTQDIEDFFSEK